MLLLSISSQPIKYAYEVEHARLEPKQTQLPELEITRKPPRLEIHSQNMQLQLDSTAMWASLNRRSTTDFMAQAQR